MRSMVAHGTQSLRCTVCPWAVFPSSLGALHPLPSWLLCQVSMRAHYLSSCTAFRSHLVNITPPAQGIDKHNLAHADSAVQCRSCSPRIAPGQFTWRLAGRLQAAFNSPSLPYSSYLSFKPPIFLHNLSDMRSSISSSFSYSWIKSTTSI